MGGHTSFFTALEISIWILYFCVFSCFCDGGAEWGGGKGEKTKLFLVLESCSSSNGHTMSATAYIFHSQTQDGAALQFIDTLLIQEVKGEATSSTAHPINVLQADLRDASISPFASTWNKTSKNNNSGSNERRRKKSAKQKHRGNQEAEQKDGEGK